MLGVLKVVEDECTFFCFGLINHGKENFVLGKHLDVLRVEEG